MGMHGDDWKALLALGPAILALLTALVELIKSLAPEKKTVLLNTAANYAIKKLSIPA